MLKLLLELVITILLTVPRKAYSNNGSGPTRRSKAKPSNKWNCHTSQKTQTKRPMETRSREKAPDGKIESAKIILINQKTHTQPLNHLLLLEVKDDSGCDSVQHPRVADPNFEKSDQSDEEKDPSVKEAVIYNATRSPQRQTFPKFLLLSLTIFCHVMASVKAIASQVQFCPYMHKRVYVRGPQFRNCSVDPGSNWKAIMVKIYQKRLVHVPATYCFKITRTVCTWAFF